MNLYEEDKMKEDKIFDIFSAREDKDKMSFDSFKAGWEAALYELDRQKALNANRKAGKFIIEDFLNASKRIIAFQNHLTGIYHDRGRQIACDGKYLVLHNAYYDESMEGKIIRDGKEIKGMYPNYERVIPETEDMKAVDFLTAKDFFIMSSTCKIRSMDKLYGVSVLIEKDSLKLTFTMAILKTVDKFLKHYPEAVLYMPKDNTKAWKAVDKKTGDLIVFMPCDSNGKDPNYIYKVNKKLLIKTAEGNN